MLGLLVDELPIPPPLGPMEAKHGQRNERYHGRILGRTLKFDLQRLGESSKSSMCFEESPQEGQVVQHATNPQVEKWH